MKRITLLSAVMALAFGACSHDFGAKFQEPGDPVLVPTRTLPAESDRIYYKAWCEDTPVVQRAKDDLRELLTQGIPVKRAWFPGACSPCECATCTAVITIELLRPDDRILAVGFVENTTNLVINCGVADMWRFDVAR